MIQEEYVTFETAKLLEKAGFPQDGYLTYYNENGTTLHSEMPCAKRHARCTKYQAMRWLREEKKIYINITWECDEDDATDTWWAYEFGNLNPMSLEHFCFDRTTYEAAAEAGIQAACKYLIEKGGEE